MIDSVKSRTKATDFRLSIGKSNVIVNPDKSCFSTMVSTISRLKHFTNLQFPRSRDQVDQDNQAISKMEQDQVHNTLMLKDAKS